MPADQSETSRLAEIEAAVVARGRTMRLHQPNGPDGPWHAVATAEDLHTGPHGVGVTQLEAAEDLLGKLTAG